MESEGRSKARQHYCCCLATAPVEFHSERPALGDSQHHPEYSWRRRGRGRTRKRGEGQRGGEEVRGGGKRGGGGRGGGGGGGGGGGEW